MPTMEYDIGYDDAANRRQYYRARVPDLSARINGHDREYQAKNLSLAGIGLNYSVEMSAGDPVTVSLYDQGELLASEVPARVAHSQEGYAGLYFDGMEKYHYDTIYAYVEDAQLSDPMYDKYASYYSV